VHIPSQENMTIHVKCSVSMRAKTYCACVSSGRRFTPRAMRCGHAHSRIRVIFYRDVTDKRVTWFPQLPAVSIVLVCVWFRHFGVPFAENFVPT